MALLIFDCFFPLLLEELVEEVLSDEDPVVWVLLLLLEEELSDEDPVFWVLLLLLDDLTEEELSDADPVLLKLKP